MPVRAFATISILMSVALLGPTGCSGDAPEAVGSSPAATDPADGPATPIVPTTRAGANPPLHGLHSARLALLPHGSPQERAYTLELTNSGRADDRYVVGLVPADVGSVSPAELTLRSGRSADLVVRLRPDAAPGAGPVQVVVSSAGARDEVAALDLPDPPS